MGFGVWRPSNNNNSPSQEMMKDQTVWLLTFAFKLYDELDHDDTQLMYAWCNNSRIFKISRRKNIILMSFFIPAFSMMSQSRTKWFGFMAMGPLLMVWDLPQHWPVWWIYIIIHWIHKIVPWKLRAVSIKVVGICWWDKWPSITIKFS